MIGWFLESASTYSRDIDRLILLITLLVGFWFVTAQGFLFYFVFKYRHREGRPAGYVTGEEKDLKRWISVPHMMILLCDVLIVMGAIQVWVNVKQTLPEPEQVVRVIGQQWAWTFVQPGPDGEIDTDDDIVTVDELHVRTDTVYHFKLQSKDVLHSFSIPVFRLKQDAVPGREITGWFEATRTGEFDIQCAEICGIGHGLMAARLFIETPEEHQAWIDSQSKA